MATTLEVILEDLSKVTKPVSKTIRTVTRPPVLALKASLRGAVTGAVLPLAPRASVALFNSLGRDDVFGNSQYEFITHVASYVVGVGSVLATAVYFCRDHSLEVAGAFAVTHACDYIYGASRRAKKRTEEERAQQHREYMAGLTNAERQNGVFYGDVDIG